jgi:hypothetical protein
MTWKDYENEIFEYFKTQYPTAEISHNVTVDGQFSKTKRQIDILIEDYVAGNRIRIVVDGKFFTKNIDVKDVEMFIGMLNDCGANKGLLITQEGFSQAAINRAFYDLMDIELDILNFKDLHRFQAFVGIPHSGGYGVVLPAPFGWILDGTRRQGMLATLYERGLTLEQAGERLEWMYVNIASKDNKIQTLEHFLDLQKLRTQAHFSDANISYLPTIKRTDTKTRLRVIEIDSYPTKEYTGFVEFDDFIFFCVLFTPEELKRKNIRKLENILQRVLPIYIKRSETKT